MEELRIQIEIVSDRIIEIELKVDDFSRYGMSPTRDDRLAQLDLLNEWVRLNTAKLMLIETLNAVESNLRNK